MSAALHPELLRFGKRLEALGFVTAVHADHLCVRLPLLASVRVRYDGERLSLEPRFGAVSRNTAIITTVASVSALLVGMTITGIAVPALVAVAGLSSLAAAYDVMRFIVTDGAVTRVTMLWAFPAGSEQRDAIGSAPAVPLSTEARDSAPSMRQPFQT
jgi:hypothetical protein